MRIRSAGAYAAQPGSLRKQLLSGTFTVPSGIYYRYWGKDQKGDICCLVADFLHTFELLQYRINKKEHIPEEAAAVKRRGISSSEIKSYKLYDRWKL